MKALPRLIAGTLVVPMLASGCLQDLGVADPARPASELSAARYSAWSDPVNLGTLVNSSLVEQQPVLSKHGDVLYFASNRLTDASDVVAEQNIWVAKRACTEDAPECAWDAPAPLGPAINGPFLDAAATLSRDEHQLFFTSQRPNAHCTTAPCDRDIWVSYRDNVEDDFGWQAPVPLSAGVNTTGEEIAPSYFENDDGGVPQLFFNTGVVQGGALALGDIFVSSLGSDGTWGARTRVDELSTEAFSDQRPSIAHDGLTIYFWSNRDGTGHLWFATRQQVSDPWSAPELVPSPISDVQTIQPYIHSHGRKETLLFIRTEPGRGNDIFVSERTRLRGSD